MLKFMGKAVGSGDHLTTHAEVDVNERRMQFFSPFAGSNPWRAQFSQTFTCTNDDDNVPVETTLTNNNEEFTFMISQSRGEGKSYGQDCMAIAKHENWEVIVLSDGHDVEGHLMSQGVCVTLPHIILRLIHERFPDEVNLPIDKDVIYEAFDECEKVVAWKSNSIPVQGTLVRINNDEYRDVLGYVTDYDEEGNCIVTVAADPTPEELDFGGLASQNQANNRSKNGINANEYEDLDYLPGDEENPDMREVIEVTELPIPPDELMIPRFSGGCTCVAIVRQVQTNDCVIATCGDSRAMIYVPQTSMEDDEEGNPTRRAKVNQIDPSFLQSFRLDRKAGAMEELLGGLGENSTLKRVFGTLEDPNTQKTIEAFITPAHNVQNIDELTRLEEQFLGSFKIEGNFLVNPFSNFMIQPTRGFGDHDMHGTGYLHIPQISENFVLPPNSVVFAASDGVFDENVWADEELVDRVAELVENGCTSNEVARLVYEETLERSLRSEYVDDISVCCYTAPVLETIEEPEPVAQGMTRLASVGSMTSNIRQIVGDKKGEKALNDSVMTKLERKKLMEPLGGSKAQLLDSDSKQGEMKIPSKDKRRKTIMRVGGLPAFIDQLIGNDSSGLLNPAASSDEEREGETPDESEGLEKDKVDTSASEKQAEEERVAPLPHIRRPRRRTASKSFVETRIVPEVQKKKRADKSGNAFSFFSFKGSMKHIGRRKNKKKKKNAKK